MGRYQQHRAGVAGLCHGWMCHDLIDTCSRRNVHDFHHRLGDGRHVGRVLVPVQLRQTHLTSVICPMLCLVC